ncbi:ankyrin repeat domain-containing protein [Xanthomonas translucens pv. graminis]|uniref:ankyrin repeat domain-containing protein n=1 Tax=Xanthomonas graminis TaxID=3390026 RepID=UPI0025410EE2|nr:ankyrin repeat domain-containing protein [Xanthomonas translucens]WIH05379.1 ankyrin repeat domain-containing protein [Xanthomonas translucens pv. graminis]
MKALPERPHLDYLKKQAKTLLDGIHRGDPASLERIRVALPAAVRLDHGAIAAMPLRLHDAQSCVAREYGFDSWAQLKDYIALQTASVDVANRQRQWRQWIFGHGYQPAKPRLAERLLRDHPDLPTGETALACAIGDASVVQAAIAGDPSWVDRSHADSGMLPLVCASFSGMVALPAYAPGIRACIDLLLAAGADPNARWVAPSSSDSLSALYGAAGHNHDAAITQRLLAAGADPNDHESLYHATETDDESIVRLLLQAGARVTGSNALFRALDFERPESLRLLLAHGGDPNESGPSGCPLLHAIRRRRSSEIVGILLDAGSDPSVHDQHGTSAYRLARRRGLDDVAERLLQAGAKADERPGDAFLGACARGDRATVQAMLAADPQWIGKLSPDALRLLPEQAANGSDEAVRVMVESGWPIGVRGGDIDGSALNWAVFHGNASLTRFLLAHGASYDERHGYDDNVYGTLSFASNAETTPGGDWLGCAQALVEAGSPLPAQSYVFPEEIASYFNALRQAADPIEAG